MGSPFAVLDCSTFPPRVSVPVGVTRTLRIQREICGQVRTVTRTERWVGHDLAEVDEVDDG